MCAKCMLMQVAKWGNSLAVRLPAAMVEALDLEEGDEVEITITKKHDAEAACDRSREEALESLRRLAAISCRPRV
jgi:antitoxin MazE